MGGIESTIPLLSRIMGYSLKPSTVHEYSLPVFISLSIQFRSFSNRSPRGLNLNSDGFVVYVTGNSMGSRLWRPMATFLRLLPWVTWSFSCIWMTLLMRGSSNSTFFTTAVTNQGRTSWVFSSTTTL